ncbi:MAG: 50S ribosomal protein L11 methyltransferase [Betaproteobacteria bacterium]|nr:50S ribosomal protein L11 methyltransferase [Betaproteobacteria bacterium]
MWLALTFKIDPSFAEPLSDAFLALGAMSVDVADAHAGGPQEVPVFAEPDWNSDSHWSLTQFRVLVPENAGVEKILRDACEAAGVETLPAFSVETVHDHDWVRETQAQFAPIQISERLWIVPSWHEAPVPQIINLRLDPGLAFGTGAHPTTRQCLRWLAANLKGGEAVLDYGCGSGILAIAAKKLGGLDVVGTDIDAQALRTASSNATANDAGIDWVLPEDLPAHRSYDIVVANILANPLRVLAPLLAAQVRVGGHLILAGILDRQVSEVMESYAPWVKLVPFEPDDGWTSLVGRRSLPDKQER